MNRPGITLRLILVASLLAGAPGPAGAQEPEAARILARADAAFEAGDTAAARTAYVRVLALDPYQSRAVYQLARTERPGSAEQVRLFRRYTQLEPGDAWGFAALGNAYRDAGALDDARAAYRRGLGLAPDAADIRSALGALGERPVRPRRLSFEPLVRGSGDSDGTRSSRLGATAMVRLPDDLTVGAAAARLEVGDGVNTVAGWTATVEARARPLPALRVTGSAGLLGSEDAATGTAVVTPVAEARVRWRPERRFAVEVRARHGPLTATPLLLAGPVVLSEVRATAELPLVGALYARALGRIGALRSPGAIGQEGGAGGGPGTGPPGAGAGTGAGTGGAAGPDQVNRRAMFGAGPVLRLLPGLEVSALVGRSGYADSTSAGYFAPEAVDLVDAGVYLEREVGAFSVALDAGGGLERVQTFDAELAGWGRALRLWSHVQWTLTPAAALRLEVEAYETRGGEAVVATTGGWRWWSAGVGVVIRP